MGPSCWFIYIFKYNNDDYCGIHTPTEKWFRAMRLQKEIEISSRGGKNGLFSLLCLGKAVAPKTKP